MTSELVALRFGAHDPGRLARFWSGLLGGEQRAEDEGSVALLPPDGTRFRLRFGPTRDPKVGPNRIHLDLTSATPAEQEATVARALGLGGLHLDVGQRPEEQHVVLADPEGNELCVVEPGNRFLAGCGPVGAINCDGSQRVGYFWSEALGWPLVWDQDEETAIQSPAGGTKIAWGGPPVAPKRGPGRLQLEIAPLGGDAPQAEIDRLLALGATHADTAVGPGGPGGRVMLADPDGNEFWVLSGRS